MKVIKIGLYEIPDGKLSDVYVDRELDISKLGKPLFFPNEYVNFFQICHTKICMKLKKKYQKKLIIM